MNGMDMMMKALMPGIDPKQIIEDFQTIGKTIVLFKEQMDRIEAKQDKIIAHIEGKTPLMLPDFLNGNRAIETQEKN